jgi:gluconolactonase
MSLIPMSALQPFGFGLDHPEGVAWGLDGKVYASGEAGQIYRVSLEGEVEQVASTGGFTLGLALDADNNVYACDMNRKQVVRVTSSGEVSAYSDGAPDEKMRVPNYPSSTRRATFTSPTPATGARGTD